MWLLQKKILDNLTVIISDHLPKFLIVPDIFSNASSFWVFLAQTSQSKIFPKISFKSNLKDMLLQLHTKNQKNPLSQFFHNP